MNKHFLSLCLIVNTLACINCKAQVVKTPTDLFKLKVDEKRFAGAPLSKLLAEIKPSITRVTVIDTQYPDGSPGFFRFQFQDPKTIDSLRLANRLPMGIVVYVKEAFTWDYSRRPAEQRSAWTAEDLRKYGHLTVTRLRVLGSQ